MAGNVSNAGNASSYGNAGNYRTINNILPAILAYLLNLESSLNTNVVTQCTLLSMLVGAYKSSEEMCTNV
jgi:hypothetical protein